MTASLPTLLTTGFLLGWSVAWPPGPINAEIARRCAAGDFRAGMAVLFGASSADAVWAIAVALGVGFLFTAAPARAGMGIVSIALLLALAFLFLRSSWRAFARVDAPPRVAAVPARFACARGGFGLGAAMALTGSGGPERSRIGSYLQALGEFGYAPQVVSCGEFNQEGGYHATIGFSMLRTARPPYSLATT
jgi:hypothetical protein